MLLVSHNLLLLVMTTCWLVVSGQTDIPTVPCLGPDCSATKPTTESTTESSTESSTTTTTISTTTTTKPPSNIQRTIVFIFKETLVGQDLFIQGGIDNVTVRPVCQLDQDAETSSCAISIQVYSLGVGKPWDKYDAWRINDTKLDWYGAQKGQGTYQGNPAYGTPLAWTTNNHLNDEYNPFNKWGPSNWMVDFNMECSETENGWFDVKAYLTNVGWEAEIVQSSCTGTGSNVPPPDLGTNHHMARCGYINRFNFGSGGCEINAF